MAQVGAAVLLVTGVLLGGGTAHAQGAVYLVRHAEKVDESSDARLSAAGHARAQRLSSMLRDVPVTHVFTSEVERTQQTAAPLLERTKLKRVVVNAKGSAEEIPRRVAALKATDVAVVVSHSNLVPGIWKGLGCTQEMVLQDTDYDRLLVIMSRAGGAPLCHALRMD